MKKKIMALVLVVALAVSAMSILAVQAVGLEVEVDGSNIKVTVSGTTSAADWVGIYKEGEQYGEGEGTITSLLWWYITEDTQTINWPADKAIADASIGETGNASGNRPEELNEDQTLKPGKYYAIVLGGADYYTPVAGFDMVEFEIKEESGSTEPDPAYTEETAFSSSIDFINTVATGGGHGGTEFFVKEGFTFEDATQMNGWLAVEAGISKYQYSTDGKVWKNVDATISARSDLAGAGIAYEGGHSTAGFDLTVSGTKDCTTLYIRAITKDNKVVNFFAFTTGAAADVAAPEIGTVDNGGSNDNNNNNENNTNTGDTSYLVVVIAMAAVLATVVLKKKRVED